MHTAVDYPLDASRKNGVAVVVSFSSSLLLAGVCVFPRPRQGGLVANQPPGTTLDDGRLRRVMCVVAAAIRGLGVVCGVWVSEIWGSRVNS